jgi:hypothetical protein
VQEETFYLLEGACEWHFGDKADAIQIGVRGLRALPWQFSHRRSPQPSATTLVLAPWRSASRSIRVRPEDSY